MQDSFTALCVELEAEIKNAYEQSITTGEAEKLAAKFLHAMLITADKLQQADLNARMQKTGVKAIKSGVYMEAATAGDKKPSDVLLQNLVDQHSAVQDAQTDLDGCEVTYDYLQNKYNIFKEAHIFFRAVCRGQFNG